MKPVAKKTSPSRATPAAKATANTKTIKTIETIKTLKTTAGASTRASATELLAALRAAHPDAHCELDHGSPFQLLVATVLSAQTTDVAVNKATPALFAAYPDARALAAAPTDDVEAKISTIGMFRQKTRNITKLATMLVEKHAGEVPRTLDALVALPGVGRKTANVVLGVAFGVPEGVVVDTHVQRLSQRLGLTTETEPEKIEKVLCEKLPREVWDITSHTLIFHGRRVCFARKPACDTCTVSALCPSAFVAEEVGRKPKRDRGEPEGSAKKATATTKPATKTAANAKTAKTNASAKTANAKKIAATRTTATGRDARPTAKTAKTAKTANKPANKPAKPRAATRGAS